MNRNNAKIGLAGTFFFFMYLFLKIHVMFNIGGNDYIWLEFFLFIYLMIIFFNSRMLSSLRRNFGSNREDSVRLNSLHT